MIGGAKTLNNVSMTSGKMLKYLDKFLHKQTYGDSHITTQNQSTHY